MLVVHEEMGEEIEMEGEGDGEVEEVPGETVELSINSVVGLTALKTMKIHGKIGTWDVIVLIDCRATHNFISSDLVQQLSIPRTETNSYGVLMGTGLTVKGSGICRGVLLVLQNLEIVADFLPLELGISDVILGIQ